jgi:protease-4
MVLALVLAGLLVLSLLGTAVRWTRDLLSLSPSKHRPGPPLQELLVKDNDSAHNVLLIPIEGIISGDLMGSSFSAVEAVKRPLAHAEADATIKAVILKVNSPGGEVLAADEIAELIAQFQKKTGKPVVASMSSLAASGGYYVSAPCRWIVAHELTITGSIGVIMHSYNYRGLLEKLGVKPDVYKSGKFKDMLSGDRLDSEITTEEREMLRRLIAQTFERFKQVIADGRGQANLKNQQNADHKGQPLKSHWREFADGRVLSGKEAFDLGLVDELGNFDTAYQRVLKLAQIPNANVVQYEPVFDLFSLVRLFGQARSRAIRLEAPLDLPKLKAGRLYFLAPSFLD